MTVKQTLIATGPDNYSRSLIAIRLQKDNWGSYVDLLDLEEGKLELGVDRRRVKPSLAKTRLLRKAAREDPELSLIFSTKKLSNRDLFSSPFSPLTERLYERLLELYREKSLT